MIDLEDYHNTAEDQWCPGCPNHGILTALKRALVKLGRAPHEVCLVSGIGQAAKLPHYLKCNFFNGLHGRAIPVATAINVVDAGLTTIVTTGDGDCYGEGGNHFLHALRRNPDITLIIHNNQIYALTKGQGSPTTDKGDRTQLQFGGVEEEPLNMLAVAILHRCGFVARGFALEVDHLSELIVQAIEHRGLSYIDVIQSCIIWGTRPVSWYKERVVKLSPEHDPRDRRAALEQALEWGETIPIGVIYQEPPREVFADRFRARVTRQALTQLPLDNRQAVGQLLEEFRPKGKLGGVDEP